MPEMTDLKDVMPALVLGVSMIDNNMYKITFLYKGGLVSAAHELDTRGIVFKLL